MFIECVLNIGTLVMCSTRTIQYVVLYIKQEGNFNKVKII